MKKWTTDMTKAIISLLKLYDLQLAGKDDSDEAEAVRSDMDTQWRILTEEEKRNYRNLLDHLPKDSPQIPKIKTLLEEDKKEDSESEDVDFNNFKGIYFNDDPNRKYLDPDTGCHFEYQDLCRRMIKLKALRKEIDKELGIPVTPPLLP